MERAIEYSVLNEKMPVSDNNLGSVIFNTNLFAILSQKLSKENIDVLYKLYYGIDENNYDNPWKAFGYKYMSFVVVDYLKWKSKEQKNTGNDAIILEKLKTLTLSDLAASENKNSREYFDFVKQYFHNTNTSYTLNIIETALGLWDEKLWVGNDKYLEKKKEICLLILSGINEFGENINLDNSKILMDHTIVEAIFKYLSEDISKYDEILVQQIPVFRNEKNGQVVYPLSKNNQYTIGIVNPWPGDKSAEAEVLSRMKVGAEDVGLGYIMLDNFGHILDETTQKKTDKFVDPKDVEFVITTHYDTEKTIDSFFYHTVWNPPEIPLNLGDYDYRITNNYLMNDDYLIYDFGGMSNHLKGMLMNKPRTLEGASMLTASFPKSKMLEPKLENPKLFYCGMNWEKVVHNSNRHEGLFKLLDATGEVKFFGPDKVDAWGGLRPWDGYKCYQYPIPFDGFSILNEINECGVCLVLSSDIHRRAGAATNRTYEACTAGAVIISDNNEFMQYYFKDAALFIDYNKNNPQDTFNQIMDKFKWISEHKTEALQMARLAQKIFIDNFAVDNQLLEIVNNHASRFQTVAKDLFAFNEKGRVLVSYVVKTLDFKEAKEQLNSVIHNIKNQYYRNIILGVVCDKSIQKDVENLLFDNGVAYKILSLELFDRKKSRCYTDGQAIRLLQNNIEHSYYMNVMAHEVWFYDHVTTLVRTIEEEDAYCAYSGRLHKDTEGYARSDFFKNMQLTTVYLMNCPDWLPVPGQLMFKHECDDYMPDYLFDCLDGYEHYAYLCILWIKYKQKIAFTKRMTHIWNAKNIDESCRVLKPEFQIRFIRDLVKYDLPGGHLGGTTFDVEAVRHYMMGIPMRSWFRVRFYKVLLRITGNGSKLGKRIHKKYITSTEQFFRW